MLHGLVGPGDGCGRAMAEEVDTAGQRELGWVGARSVRQREQPAGAVSERDEEAPRSERPLVESEGPALLADVGVVEVCGHKAFDAER